MIPACSDRNHLLTMLLKIIRRFTWSGAAIDWSGNSCYERTFWNINKHSHNNSCVATNIIYAYELYGNNVLSIWEHFHSKNTLCRTRSLSNATFSFLITWRSSSSKYAAVYKISWKSDDFCHAMRCISAAYAVMRYLSVSVCVCHVRELCQNE